MNSLYRVVGFALLWATGIAGGGCEPLEPSEGDALDDTAALDAARKPAPDEPPEGFLFALNGTHVRDCTNRTRCPTLFATLPSPGTCAGSGGPTVAYIIHQRGTDWNGVDGERELHGEGYATSLGPTLYDQSIIVQCCPKDPSRVQAPNAFFAFKTCPDPCGGPPGTQCPSTCGSTVFGQCRGCPATVIETDRCDLALVEAGWKDPHAPHDLAHPSGDDKVVWEVHYRAAWTCGDGVCDTDESCSTCADDCCAP